jgi:hypothetical protein
MLTWPFPTLILADAIVRLMSANRVWRFQTLRYISHFGANGTSFHRTSLMFSILRNISALLSSLPVRKAKEKCRYDSFNYSVWYLNC